MGGDSKRSIAKSWSQLGVDDTLTISMFFAPSVITIDREPRSVHLCLLAPYISHLLWFPPPSLLLPEPSLRTTMQTAYVPATTTAQTTWRPKINPTNISSANVSMLRTLCRAINTLGPCHILPVIPVPRLPNSPHPPAHISGRKATGGLIQRQQGGRPQAEPHHNRRPNSSTIIPEPYTITSLDPPLSKWAVSLGTLS